jgi:outer membrane immunogenic protein
MFYRVLITAASVVAMTAAANAADMYRAPAPSAGAPYVGVNWSGFYVGVNGGYGWNSASLDAGANSPKGGFGGGQIGYNAQRGNFVFGIESDIQGAGIKATSYGADTEMNWFGTARGRLGYAFDRVLVYGTGGFAYGNVKDSALGSSISETQLGWVAGGGVEYKFSPSWSAKAEYQFMSLDATDAAGAGRLGDFALSRTEVSTARLGVNYFVSPSYEPLK